MNRRGFLKLVGVLVVVPSIPLPKLSTPMHAPRRIGSECNCPQCKSKLALGKWLQERMDEDMITALSGKQEAA